ncbi:hypothetical protein ONZ45_g1060 [Pleurotus djamor]|nr:hypothetical protein ONZ45_g1060 [Pleurotus djamor]
MSILAFPNASDSSSSTESAGLSPTTTLNVRFAPLPDLSKRKKRYHQPLGVAARSEIMRKRKAALAGAEYGASGEQDPTWSESDGQHQHHRHHRSHPRRTIMGDNEEELLEDPFITLGKMVKGASKLLWRKVSHKRTEKGDEGEEGGRKSLEVEVTGDEPGKNGQKDAGETIAGEVPSETLSAEARRERKTSSRSSQDAPSSPLLLGDALDDNHGGAGINAYEPHHILRIDGFSVRHGRSCLSLVDRNHFFNDHTRRPGHNRRTRDCGRSSNSDLVRDIAWNHLHFNIFRPSFAAASDTTNYHAATAHTTVAIVSSLPPVSVTEPVTAPPGGQTQQSDDGGSNSTNMGPIIGGAVGGFFGLLGIVAVIWFIMKRRSRWDDIFEKEEEEQGRARHDGRFSLDVDNEPKPYQYGLVGHVPSPSVQSPPNSPPLGPTTMNHNRRPSATGMPAPLSLSPSFTTSGHSAPQSGANLSRPSSAGSTQPLWSAGQQMGRSTNDFGTRPPSMHSHSHSSSITSPPTSFANWGNTGNVTGTGAFMGGAALGGAVGAAISDPVPHRSGSPVSMQEPPRRLQLANATPPSSIYSPEHDHHRGISNDSTTRVAPTHVAEFDPYSVSSIDTPLVQGHPGVTRTNTKGIVILDPPQREVRVAQDGGRILMASTSAASGSGSSSAGPSTSQAQSSSSASASASTSAPRPETRQTVSDPPSQGSSSQSQSQGLPTAPPAYEE